MANEQGGTGLSAEITDGLELEALNAELYALAAEDADGYYDHVSRLQELYGGISIFGAGDPSQQRLAYLGHLQDAYQAARLFCDNLAEAPEDAFLSDTIMLSNKLLWDMIELAAEDDPSPPKFDLAEQLRFRIRIIFEDMGKKGVSEISQGIITGRQSAEPVSVTRYNSMTTVVRAIFKQSVSRQGWRLAAKCFGQDTSFFYPDDGVGVEVAKRFCSTCPVKEECLEEALMNPRQDGVWGGTSERERKKLRRSRGLKAR